MSTAFHCSKTKKKRAGGSFEFSPIHKIDRLPRTPVRSGLSTLPAARIEFGITSVAHAARPSAKNTASVQNVAFVYALRSPVPDKQETFPRLLLEAYSPPPGALAKLVICVPLAFTKSVIIHGVDGGRCGRVAGARYEASALIEAESVNRSSRGHQPRR